MPLNRTVCIPHHAENEFERFRPAAMQLMEQLEAMDNGGEKLSVNEKFIWCGLAADEAGDNSVLNEINVSDDDKHCMQAVMNHPEWIVSNMGRVLSVKNCNWIAPTVKNATLPYWTFQGTMAHRLVGYYFMDESDKIALEEWGINGTRVHHVIPIKTPNHANTLPVEKRLSMCVHYNNKENLNIVQHTEEHIGIMHNLARNRDTIVPIEFENKQLESAFKNIRDNTILGNEAGIRLKYSVSKTGSIERTYSSILKIDLKKENDFTDEQLFEMAKRLKETGSLSE